VVAGRLLFDGVFLPVVQSPARGELGRHVLVVTALAWFMFDSAPL